MSRIYFTEANITPLTSGTLFLVAIYLIAGQRINYISFLSGNNNFKNYIAVSGTKTAEGIKNLHYAFYRLSNTNASAPDLPESIIRILKDSDGLASQI